MSHDHPITTVQQLLAESNDAVDSGDYARACDALEEAITQVLESIHVVLGRVQATRYRAHMGHAYGCSTRN